MPAQRMGRYRQRGGRSYLWLQHTHVRIKRRVRLRWLHGFNARYKIVLRRSETRLYRRYSQGRTVPHLATHLRQRRPAHLPSHIRARNRSPRRPCPHPRAVSVRARLLASTCPKTVGRGAESVWKGSNALRTQSRGWRTRDPVGVPRALRSVSRRPWWMRRASGTLFTFCEFVTEVYYDACSRTFRSLK